MKRHATTKVSIAEAERIDTDNGSYKSELRDGMRIDWDVPIRMDDGVVLRADVYRPEAEARYPVLMNYGPYAKGLPFQVGYPAQWQALERDHPDIMEGSSCKYQAWEAADPEKWVHHGYACVRVDSRGAGRSEGYIDCFGPREVQDYYECIEWAARQPWSNEKVGLAGVSYYAMNQWQVAAKHPPHLAAICPFEGASDFYRDAVRHGGILSTFWMRWYPLQVTNVQHGVGTRGRTNPNTGELIAGPETLPEDFLARQRADLPNDHLNHKLDDSWFRDRSPDLSAVEVPVLSCANIGGQGLHLRGNVEGFLQAGSKHKWLEIHGLEHWTHFYTDYGRDIQKRFYDHFLKGIDNGWEKQPRVLLQVRHVDRFVERAEEEWPLARTRWTKFYLDAETRSFDENADVKSGSASFRAMEGQLTFWSEVLKEEIEITGPAAAKLFIASSTKDADVFVTLRAFASNGREVLFAAAVDPNAPLTHGWLRASHRKLDLERSLPYRPWHSHDEARQLTPSQVYELDIEIWPTSIVLPKGYRLAFTIHGKDFDHGLPEPMPKIYGIPMRGCSVFLHDDPTDRAPDIYNGETTVHTGGDRKSYLLLPIIPPKV